MQKLTFILLLFFAFSCKEKKPQKAAHFIDKNKMIDLIVDMKIAEKARTIQNKDKKKNINYMAYVYEKYKIDSVQFKENNDYYTDNIAQYQEIYEEVQKRLKDSVAKYKKIKKVNDSILREKKKKKPKLKLDKSKLKAKPFPSKLKKSKSLKKVK